MHQFIFFPFICLQTDDQGKKNIFKSFFEIKTLWVLSRVTRLGNFLPIGLLLVAHYDFLKRQSSPNKWLLFAQANLLHFHLNKHFQNMIFKSGLM
jgi:hypothetical protein